MSGAEERAVLRKRVRELESALSRAVTTLSRERKERHEYQIEEKRRLKEDEEAIRAWRKEMEAQMARVRKEAQEQSIMAQQGTMNELSALEQETKALQEREKQARVDLLRRQVARRMMNADITRGWSAWYVMWEERTRNSALIRRAGMRLIKPAMSFAYGTWKHDWDQTRIKEAMAKAREREALAAGGVTYLEEQLRKLREHYEVRLAASEQARQELAAELEGLTGSVEEKERLLAEQEAKAREERIELLRRQIVRRIMNKDIGRGWTAWYTTWEEKVIQKQRMQRVANKLRAPETSAAYAFWRQDWEKAVDKAKQMQLKMREAFLTDGAEGLKDELNRVRVEFEKRFQTVVKERDELRARLDQAGGDLEAKQRAHQEELQRQREQRVKHLSEMIARRILKKDLARGWTAWHGMWEERVTAKRRLQAAAARMKNPALANFFGTWASYSIEARHNKSERLHQQNEAMLGQGVAELRAELAQVRSESADEINALTRERDKLRELLGQAGGDLEAKQRAHQEELDRQKKLRVKQLTEMIARRILKKDQARGWTAWHGMWEERVIFKRRLLAATSRMKSPELANFFGTWASYSIEARHNKSERLHQQKEASLDQGVTQLKAELITVRNEYQIKLDAMKKERDLYKNQLDQLNGGLNQADLKIKELTAKQKAAESELLSKAAERDSEMSQAQRAFQLQLKEQKEKEEKEKEKRVKHLSQMIARRILKKDLSRGWTAWQGMWEEKVYQRRQLQKVASKLRMPERSASFRHWKESWDSAQKAAERKAYAQRVAALEGDSGAAHAELERVRFDLQRRVDVAEAKNRDLLERITALDGGMAEAELKALEKVSQEKEKRVEHLCSMIARRIMRRDLSRGWMAWFDMWEEKTTQLRKLQAAASRLRKPELAATYAFWHSDWQTEKQKRKVAMQREEHRGALASLQDDLKRVQEECKRKVEVAEAARAEMLAKLTLLDGGTAAAEEALKAQLEKEEREKEQRIKHLCEMIANRIMRKDLARAWTSWFCMWEEKVVQKRKLQAAASRLSKPERSAAFHHWLEDWEQAEREAEQVEQRRKEEAQSRTVAGLEEQLEDLKAEMARKIAMLEREKRQALEAQLEELLGTHNAEMSAELAREKEARINQMQKSLMRRMINLDLTRGWQAWLDWWEEKNYHQRLMRKAGGRMGNPALSSAFGWWERETRELKRQAEHEADLKKRAELEENLRAKALEAGKLAMVKLAMEDELRSLRQKVNYQANDIEAKKAALATADHERQAYVQLQELFRVSRESLKTAEEERDTVKVHLRNQQVQAEEMLRSLLAEQREKVAVDLVRNQQQIVSLQADLKQAKEVAAAMVKEIAALKAKLPPPPKKVVGLQLSGKGTMPEQIAAALASQSARVTDLFRSWDKDGDGEVSKAEFRKAIPALGIVVDECYVDELFDMWDADGGGSLAPKELKKLLSGKPPPEKKKLRKLDPADGPMSDQLADVLKSQSTRVMDLFRSWDRDGDGEVSKAEFENAFPALGIDVPKQDVYELFNLWDSDGGGKLNYKELKKILSGPISAKSKATPTGGKPAAATPTSTIGGTAKAGMAAQGMLARLSPTAQQLSLESAQTPAPPPLSIPKSPTE
jgi:Ca2+-binding EF-hand superfamily protein